MANKLLNAQVIDQVKEVFNQLQHPVQLVFFGQKSGCDYCEDTLQLVQEVADLSEKIHVSVYDLDDHPTVAATYGIDKSPGLVVAAKEGEDIRDFGIRYSGIPSGHEFSSFIHSLILVSGRESGLNEKTRQFLAQLTQPVHLQVFVTPT